MMKAWNTTNKMIWLRGSPLGGSGVGNVDLTLTADTAPQSVSVSKKSKVRSCEVSFGAYQSGSGDPSPENVRPIYGAQGAKIWVTGVNLLEPKLYTNGSYNPTVGTKWNLAVSSNQLTDAGNGAFTIALGNWASRLFLCRVVSGTTYHFKASISATDVAVTSGLLSNDYTVLDKSNATGATVNKNGNITPSQDGYFYCLFAARNSDQTVTITEPQFEVGNQASPYTPYRSDTVDVVFPAVGRNLFDVTNYPFTSSKYVDGNDGKVKNNAGFAATYGFVPLSGLDGQDITLNKRPGGYSPGIAFYSSESESGFISGSINYKVTAGTAWTVTVPNGTKYCRFTVQDGATDIQLEKGSSATAYEPYTNTLYSGHIDPVAGTVVATHTVINIAADNVSSINVDGNNTRVNLNIDLSSYQNYQQGLCNKFIVTTSWGANAGNSLGIALNNVTNDQIIINKANGTTKAEIQDVIGDGLQIYYPLATPLTFTIPPQSLAPLEKGQSYAWAQMERDVT